jgi:hypothetical protein
LQAAVWTSMVVVPDVLGEHRFEVWRNRKRRPEPSISEAKLRATCVTHGPFGLVVAPRT